MQMCIKVQRVDVLLVRVCMQMPVVVGMQVQLHVLVLIRPVRVAVGVQKRFNDAPVFVVHLAGPQFFMQQFFRQQGLRQVQFIGFQQSAII